MSRAFSVGGQPGRVIGGWRRRTMRRHGHPIDLRPPPIHADRPTMGHQPRGESFSGAAEFLLNDYLPYQLSVGGVEAGLAERSRFRREHLHGEGGERHVLSAPTLLYAHYHLPVHTIIILLRPEAAHTNM